MEHFDVCIIGGGSGGYAAAMRAVDLGKKVALIEADKIGGAGIYNGALSSKTMWEYSQQILNARKITNQRLFQKLKFPNLMQSVDEAIFDRKYQLMCHIKLLENEAHNCQFKHFRGKGSLLDKNTVQIKNKSKSEKISADFIIIATGSSPRHLNEIKVDEQYIMTSDGIANMDHYPQSMVILGAGVIGCEFATIFSNIGKTEVSLIDKGNRILPFEDQDVSELITEELGKNNVRFHSNSSLIRMETKNGGVEYELLYDNGEQITYQVEKALISVGRTPNTQHLSLEKLGLELNNRGKIIENDTQTSIENIFAIGDVSSRMALVNVAELQGRRAVEKMFNYSDKLITYKNISTIMFLNPEVASVGMNEVEARKQEINYKCVKLDYSCIARAIAMRKTTGFIKIIVTDDEEMKILGMRVVGEHASSAIQAVALLISMNKGINELVDLIHPHPSIIEGIQECLRMLLNKSIFKSEVFGDKMKCYRYVNGEELLLTRLRSKVDYC